MSRPALRRAGARARGWPFRGSPFRPAAEARTDPAWDCPAHHWARSRRPSNSQRASLVRKPAVGRRCRNWCPGGPRPPRQVPAVVRLAQVRRQLLPIRVSVRCQQQVSVGPEDAAQLLHPGDLALLRQMGEDRQGVDEVEACVWIGERGIGPVHRKTAEGQVTAAPGDETGIVVGAVDLNLPKRLPVARDPSAAATEVEDGGESGRLDAIPCQGIEDRLKAAAAAVQEPGCVRGAGDQMEQARRWNGQAVRALAPPVRAVPDPGADQGRGRAQRVDPGNEPRGSLESSPQAGDGCSGAHEALPAFRRSERN